MTTDTSPVTDTRAEREFRAILRRERVQAAVHARVTRQIAAHEAAKPPARRWTRAAAGTLAGLVAVGLGVIVAIAFFLGPRW